MFCLLKLRPLYRYDRDVYRCCRILLGGLAPSSLSKVTFRPESTGTAAAVLGTSHYALTSLLRVRQPPPSLRSVAIRLSIPCWCPMNRSPVHVDDYHSCASAGESNPSSEFGYVAVHVLVLVRGLPNSIRGLYFHSRQSDANRLARPMLNVQCSMLDARRSYRC